jgi:hypothetical protein
MKAEGIYPFPSRRHALPITLNNADLRTPFEQSLYPEAEGYELSQVPERKFSSLQVISDTLVR